MEIILTALISAGLVFLVGVWWFKLDVRDIKKEVVYLKNTIDKKIKNEVEIQVNAKVSKDVIEMILKHSSKTASPLTLNEVGTSTIEKMKGKEWLNENIDALYKEFEDIDDEYDIQERSKEVLLEWKDKIINDRKKLLYSTGTSINEFIVVMSLVLRDMVFEKRGYKEVQNRK